MVTGNKFPGLWPFERAFLPEGELEAGLVAPRRLTVLTVILWLVFIATLLPLYWWGEAPTTTLGLLLALSLPLARLTALDFCCFVLADVYTLPLLALGLVVPPTLGWASWWQGIIGAAVGLLVPLAISVAVEKIKKRDAGLGGGDIKFMAAAGAWLGWMGLPFFICLACLIALPLAFSRPREAPIPFGPGLCLSFWAFLAYGDTLWALVLP